MIGMSFICTCIGQPSTCSLAESDLNRGFSEAMVDQPENSSVGDSDNGVGSANEPSLLVSSSVGAWDILIGLMSSLRSVAQLYLEQGIMKEAYHYAREGAMLARGLLLPGW